MIRFPTSSHATFLRYLKNRLKAKAVLTDEYPEEQLLETLLVSDFSVDWLLTEVDKLDRLKLLGEGIERYVSCQDGWRVKFNVVSFEEKDELELRQAKSVREA